MSAYKYKLAKQGGMAKCVVVDYLTLMRYGYHKMQSATQWCGTRAQIGAPANRGYISPNLLYVILINIGNTMTKEVVFDLVHSSLFVV